MMIAIEGPDGAGKTSLANDLAFELGRKVYHPGGPALGEDDFRLRVTAQERAENVVHDRLMVISEPIYAGALARSTFYTVNKQADYYLRNLTEPLYLVYCRLENANMMYDNIDRTEKAHKSPEHIEAMRKQYHTIVEMYDRRLNELCGPEYPMVRIMNFNWHYTALERVVAAIQEKVQ
jgi:thymidylate kinase